MRRNVVIACVTLLIVALTTPAFAWEFAVSGVGEWRYRYFARQGGADLFGTRMIYSSATPQQPTLGLAGPVNNTVLVQGFSAKGSDAQTHDTRFWFYPELRINRQVFRDRPKQIRSVGMSVGLWEKFWVTARAPRGVLSFGRRPWGFGTGWSTLHEKDADRYAIQLAATYGPRTFIIGPWSVNGGPGDRYVANSVTIVPTNNSISFPQTVAPLYAAAATDKTRQRPGWTMPWLRTLMSGLRSATQCAPATRAPAWGNSPGEDSAKRIPPPLG